MKYLYIYYNFESGVKNRVFHTTANLSKKNLQKESTGAKKVDIYKTTEKNIEEMNYTKLETRH